MSPRVPILKPREVLRALERAGFEIHHHSGSHAQLKHPGKLHLRVTAPRHDRFDLPVPVFEASFVSGFECGRVPGILVKED
jgi:predicted RNA binding protein YcfA (HicA-like mRNA interferase family)